MMLPMCRKRRNPKNEQCDTDTKRTVINNLEIMRKNPEPTISQLARMKELEDQLIPEGIRKEKALGSKLRPLVALLEGEGSLPEIRRRTVIELRFFSLLEWTQIAEALFPDEWSEASQKRRSLLLQRAFRYQRTAIKYLDEFLGAGCL